MYINRHTNNTLNNSLEAFLVAVVVRKMYEVYLLQTGQIVCFQQSFETFNR